MSELNDLSLSGALKAQREEYYLRLQRLEARARDAEAERDALRDALREAQEFLSNLNEDEPSRKMPAIQASAMCIHIERKCRAALKETDT